MYLYLKGGKVIDSVKNILIENERIKEVSREDISLPKDTEIINCEGKVILPGIIDVHVHFREPGNECKADMTSESSAALSGGVTTICDMPNNTPAITSTKAFLDKLELAENKIQCNFKLFFGLTNNNADEALALENDKLAGLKLFLGSSTGNMLVDNKDSLEYLFKKSKKIIVAHCEDESLIKQNIQKYKQLKTCLPYNVHSLIRDTEVCYKSSLFAVSLAKKYHTDFHIAHITTQKEISLLSNERMKDKHITAEVSPNHLFFCEEDYKQYGTLIKCNPSIKTLQDRQALRNALKEGYIDIVATDHAPHLLTEKQQDYFSAPSGIPSIQFSLLMMLEIAQQEHWDISLLAEKMCKNPAERFHIKQRGEIKKGNFADIVIINPNATTTISKEMIKSKCGWSPLEGKTFNNKIEMTIFEGKIAYSNRN